MLDDESFFKISQEKNKYSPSNFQNSLKKHKPGLG